MKHENDTYKSLSVRLTEREMKQLEALQKTINGKGFSFSKADVIRYLIYQSYEQLNRD